MEDDQGKAKYCSFHTEDKQWDARFNVQQDEDLEDLLRSAKTFWDTGRLQYLLVGGPEIGTRPYQDDYQIRHVHVALMFINRISKRSILSHLNIKQGNGYYLVPRNRNLPYSGWKDHHIKKFSKINPSELSLYEAGQLPKDHAKAGQSFVKRSDEEKKRKIDDVLIEMRRLIEEGEEGEEEAFTKFPRTYLQYGEKLKSMVMQTKDKFSSNGDPHLWVFGDPGCGKSALLHYVYPKYYKKNLYNKFFDLYKPTEHSHVMLEDLDHDAVDRLTLNFIKTLCDESGFAIDQKYKSPQLARSAILVTSNFRISDVVTQSETQNVFSRSENLKALHRRFWEVDGKALLQLLGLKLLPKYELQQLKKAGNTDPGKIFIRWDYVSDMPKCEPIQSPTALSKMIKDYYYEYKQ